MDPGQWRFIANRYGRPEIKNAEAQNAGLVFNISHTDGLIVMATTQHCAVGIDVENIRTRNVSLGIAQHYFAPCETAIITAQPANCQQQRFFEYWTLKEAYIKARGMGLSLPLDKFSFYYPDDQTVAIAMDPELADDAARWRFWNFQPTTDHLIALCAERLTDDVPNLIGRRVCPAQSEQEYRLEPLRMSANVITRHDRRVR